MPVETEAVSLPNTRAIENLRGKLRIPTERWDDFLGDIHAKGFAIAGATKADLLRDFHDAITEALEAGEGISEFRRRFDSIVQEHGWSYRGERGWRTRVIYDNNLRSARMAGRWSQMQETKTRRPYLQYLTVGDDRVRPQHAAWDRLILPIDDPFWNTHYPPNDYGCRCSVRTLSDRDVQRQGGRISDAPQIRKTERVNSRTGEVYGDIPEGVGVGWDYNVGKAWLAAESAFAEKLATLPPRIRNNIFSDSLEPHQYAQNDGLPIPGSPSNFARWCNTLRESEPVGEYRPAAYLSSDVLNGMDRNGVPPRTALVVIDDRTLKSTIQRHSITEDEAADLLTTLNLPHSIYLDKAAGELLGLIELGGRRFLFHTAILEFSPSESVQRSFNAHAITKIDDGNELSKDWAAGYELLKGGL